MAPGKAKPRQSKPSFYPCSVSTKVTLSDLPGLKLFPTASQNKLENPQLLFGNLKTRIEQPSLPKPSGKHSPPCRSRKTTSAERASPSASGGVGQFRDESGVPKTGSAWSLEPCDEDVGCGFGGGGGSGQNGGRLLSFWRGLWPSEGGTYTLTQSTDKSWHRLQEAPPPAVGQKKQGLSHKLRLCGELWFAFEQKQVVGGRLNHAPLVHTLWQKSCQVQDDTRPTQRRLRPIKVKMS